MKRFVLLIAAACALLWPMAAAADYWVFLPAGLHHFALPGRLVFASLRYASDASTCDAQSCNWELMSVNPDGTGLQRLTDDDLPEGNPVLSPDGTHIAYDAIRSETAPVWQVYVEAADGSDEVVVTPLDAGLGDCREPAWSPSGDRLAFSCAPRDYVLLGLSEIYVANADGSGLRRLTYSPAFSGALNVAPDWSPDGQRIAFSSTRDTYKAGYGVFRLYTMAADGADVTRLTGLLPYPGAGTPATWDGNPAWSPDGQWILYDSNRADWNGSDLWHVRLDGSGSARIVANATHPDWSPAGDRITFSREGDVWLAATDGAEPIDLTASSGDTDFDVAPTWGH